MKRSFRMVAKDEVKVKVQVNIDTGRYNLTRGEARRFQVRLQNRVHEILRQEGYDVNQISLR